MKYLDFNSHDQTHVSPELKDIIMLQVGLSLQVYICIFNICTSPLRAPSKECILNKDKLVRKNKKRVTGIGGIFFKTKNPNQIKDWYNRHLGFNTDQYGTCFEWRQADDGTKKGFSQWSPFDDSSTYFQPSEKKFMINYRVEDLEWLVGILKKEGVVVLDEIESYDYGKFVHILDPEENKIELWEPNDDIFDKSVKGRTK